MVLRPIIAVGLVLGCASSFVRGQQESATLATSGPSSIGQQLDRLASLDEREAAELKQRLLRQLTGRIQTATKITLRDLTPYERLRQQDQTPQSPDQREFTTEQIRQLWQQTGRLEQSVVEHLARQYRIEIYNTFRQQRSKYDRRRYAWSRVERAWQQAGQAAYDRPEMIRWLDAAITASRAGKVARLPATPDFVASRTGRRIDVPQGASPLDDPPDSDHREAESGVRIAHSPQRVKAPLQPAERSEETTPLPPIIHADPPLLAQLPSAPTVGSPDADEMPVSIAHRPAPPTDASAEDRSSVEKSHDPVRVNLAEIDARVAGYGLALATLRERLEQPGPWTADRLAPLIETLDELATRRDDLQLYYRLVPVEQQRQLSAMASPAAAAALLARRIVQARNQSKQPPDVVRLDRFSQRIREILRP